MSRGQRRPTSKQTFSGWHMPADRHQAPEVAPMPPVLRARMLGHGVFANECKDRIWLIG
jgi:hypothetical protein